MSSTESQLKALTVAKLKEQLAELNLPQTGVKGELIARILAAQSGSTASATAGDDFDPLLAPPQDFDWNAEEDSTAAAPAPPAPAPIAPVASAPSLAAVDEKLAEIPADTTISAPPPSTTTAPIPAPPAPTPAEATPAAPAAPVQTAEEKEAAALDLIEKKKARAARFGVPYVEKTEPAAPKKAPTPVLPPTSGKGKGPKAAPAAAAVPAKPKTPAVPVVAAPKKELDPVEEEKKRKRAEKFGPVAPPAEKKTKTDAAAPAAAAEEVKTA